MFSFVCEVCAGAYSEGMRRAGGESPLPGDCLSLVIKKEGRNVRHGGLALAAFGAG